MPAPVRISWYNRPGWGEFKALRGGRPTHGGFDSYTLPKATIYGTADGGKVIGKGFVDGGWGHYIDVYYPRKGLRRSYVQRDCHMNEATGLRIGAPVNTGTALGRVGVTGNAKNIFWIRLGILLWHVHSEVYLSGVVNLNNRTDPLKWWGATTAGGGITPITPTKPSAQIEENTMDMIRYEERYVVKPGKSGQYEATYGTRTAEWIVFGNDWYKSVTHAVAKQWVKILGHNSRVVDKADAQLLKATIDALPKASAAGAIDYTKLATELSKITQTADHSKTAETVLQRLKAFWSTGK